MSGRMSLKRSNFVDVEKEPRISATQSKSSFVPPSPQLSRLACQTSSFYGAEEYVLFYLFALETKQRPIAIT